MIQIQSEIIEFFNRFSEMLTEKDRDLKIELYNSIIKDFNELYRSNDFDMFQRFIELEKMEHDRRNTTKSIVHAIIARNIERTKVTNQKQEAA